VLGFGHNLDADATMAAYAHFDGRGASLRATDIAGLVFLYPGSSSGGTPPQSFTLSVTRTGAGGGSVTSSPAGITCGSDCSEAFASGTSVTLTAIAWRSPAGAARAPAPRARAAAPPGVGHALTVARGGARGWVTPAAAAASVSAG
jgi:hypothetical protein